MQLMRAIIGVLLVLTCSACSQVFHNKKICSAESKVPHISSLMMRACSGDRDTQYELGRLFEEGSEVQQNYQLALSYYKLAATPSTGQTHIYVPGAGKVAGYVMPVQTGAAHPGDARAKFRLGIMYREGRGVNADPDRAEQYFSEARAQGVTE
ncbi:tetratricopeptide repeat protein [Kordiimonas sp. SCSIO 12610]|uniref:tetratricopeptide repeat protein n=1 Tax=Kordiimonas sp. SCSIO 12610 TaxID=2829597 RepID=UPI00210EFB14|nr:tetratricopeptide repeat protein [Kordiimonas sp. SCSIO 12610]UTW56848.1 sel1 repeat family protein [Kordiimonas sp. SCSIO 12610]